MPMIRARLAMFWVLALLVWSLGIGSHAVLYGGSELWPLSWPAIVATALWGVASALVFAALLLIVDRTTFQQAPRFTKRLLKMILLSLGPLAASFIWPQIVERAKTVDVTVAVAQGSGRRDVMVSGYINEPAKSALSTQKLTIQEPGREPYERLVALSPDRTFEIVLGEPVRGNYSVTVHRRDGRERVEEGKQLKLPDLRVSDVASNELPSSEARDFDYQRLFLFPSITALAAGLFLFMGLSSRQGRYADHGPH